MPDPENKLQKTADAIEAAVKDIKENKTSPEDVINLIEEKTAEDRAAVKASGESVEKINLSLGEANAAIKELQGKLASIRSHRDEFQDTGKGYPGKFSCAAEAKRFALLFMAAATADSEKTLTHHKAACKGLEDIGITPYWLDPNGRKSMTGSSMTGGSALVTVEQAPTLIKLLESYGKYRANALNMPMGAGSTTVPKIDGLLTVYCPGEGGSITAVDPTIKVVNLIPKTLTALTAYSMELEDDSLVALGELLADLFARSFAYYEDLCGFLGDGTSTYFGFTGITGALRAVSSTISSIKSLVVAAGNAYSEITLANFEALVGTLPEFASGEAKWYVHRYFYWTVMVKLALAAGGANATEIITGSAAKQKQYLSYPVEFTQVMPKAAANSQICAILGALRQGAYLGMRGGMEFAQSDQRYFDQGLIAVRGRDRVSINAHGVGDTTNAGPICALITAAS